jgi:hypothetical protein
MSLTNEDKDRINAQLERAAAEAAAQLERVETTLLTEFHKWAGPIEMRRRSHTAALRELSTLSWKPSRNA